MSVYKRGEAWWFKFRIHGQLIRESAKTSSKTLARDAERVRRRELEEAVNRIPKREKMPLFSIAAREWLDNRIGITPGSIDRYRQQVALLSKEFGNRLVCDIDHHDVTELQRKRQTQGRAGRTVNYEITTLRMILKSRGLWAPIGERVRALRERHDVGRALSREDERKLLDAIGKSDSPVLLPLFVLTMDTGLRASEARSLRRRDLELTRKDGAIAAGRLIVAKSKTEAGKGRTIPLTNRVCAALTLWLSRFPEAGPGSFIFPHHRVACRSGRAEHHLYELDLATPIGSWKRAWKYACSEKGAGVSYRWHDLRHTFVSRLAENAAVSEETIRSLAGHVSKQMLQRYSHIRTHAKQAAIAALEQDAAMLDAVDRGEAEIIEISADGAQNGAQSQPDRLH
jgi:integrase